jgi:hypothetical protein
MTGREAPAAPGRLIRALTSASGNGPAAAVTPRGRLAAASWAGVALAVSTVTATWAP